MPRENEISVEARLKMAFRPKRWIDRVLRQRAEAQWARLSDSTAGLRSGRLAYLRDEAAMLRRNLDRFLMQSDHRLAISRAVFGVSRRSTGLIWTSKVSWLSHSRTSGVIVGLPA